MLTNTLSKYYKKYSLKAPKIAMIPSRENSKNELKFQIVSLTFYFHNKATLKKNQLYYLKELKKTIF